jgi:ketosteroid isomerase-like protein
MGGLPGRGRWLAVWLARDGTAARLEVLLLALLVQQRLQVADGALNGRTYGDTRLVDEQIISFTHTQEIEWMLPGVAPTGRKVSAAFVVIVGIDGGKVAYEHIYWDQASVLVQLGLLDPAGLPVAGREAAAQLLNPAILSARP